MLVFWKKKWQNTVPTQFKHWPRSGIEFGNDDDDDIYDIYDSEHRLKWPDL